jgi:hypothetical protein
MHEDHLAELRAALARVRRRWVAARALRAVARLTSGVGIAVLLVLVVELWLAPPDLTIVLLVAAALLAALVFAIRLLWLLRETPSDQRVARLVEERCPEFEDRVASATELGGRDGETAFHRLVVADAAAKLRETDPAGVVVSSTQLRNAVVRGGLSAVALLALLTLGGEPIGRVARTAWLFAFPSNLTLLVEPGDVRVSSGQPVPVRVRLRGRVYAPMRTAPTLLQQLGDESHLVAMRAAPDGDGYVAEFPEVTESFTYRVSAATLRSRDYHVDALAAPRIRRVDVEYLYPAFTGLSPRVEEDGGDVYAPAGTRVRLTVSTDAPVVAGRVVFSDGRQHALDLSGPDTLQGTFTVETDGEYALSAVDGDGLSSPDDIGYLIRVTADRVPEVQVLRPRGDQEVTSLEEVTIEARADDDHRIAALELLYTVAGRAERVVSLGPSDGVAAASVTGRYTLFAEDLDLSPGDFVTFHVRARDVGYTEASNEVRSDIFFLEVRPFDNEFEEAQSQSAMGQDAERLGDLATVQKEIIVATWRLDALTRSEAVDDDIQSVAQAQEELRDRAARASDALRGRGGGGAGGATQQGALSAALDAMASAQTALQGMQTGVALPSEMDALNELLRAQAEIRRRQVSSQSVQGAQTPGTQAEEDLSELFDRELRRDQETNYETGSRGAASDRAELSETLRRLRELAERQEEVNRELNRSNEDTPEEARRRALERLTREQQAIREQLEHLAQEFGDAQRRGGGGQGGQPGGGALDRAAEQMRRASSELRRANAEQARAEGQQVVDELRRVERQLRGEAADEHEGAVAESALEVRQIAEAQRLIAEEAAEVAAGNRTDESRARLADSKDRLADRVDALGDELRELPGDPADASPGGAVGSALDALAKENVGRSMRAGADRLRHAAAGSNPEAEASLAETLAEIADQLGRAASEDGAEVRRLADQLDVVQELRQALQQLSGDRGVSDAPGGQTESADPETEEQSAGALSRSGAGPGGERREYMAGLERSPGLLEELREGSPELRRDLDAWTEHWTSGAAPGAEASKRDFANWESLRSNLDTALQRLEDAYSRDLAATDLRERVTGGGEEPVPARYQRLVDQYYRSLAGEPVSP